MAGTLSPRMTLRDFENGYWYLDQLKHFAERIGIPAALGQGATSATDRAEYTE